MQPDLKRNALTFPAKGVPRAESDISFPRSKPRLIWLSAAYRLMRIARRVFGETTVLRFLLNANWTTWRFSYELSAELYGPTFQNLTFGVSDDLLARWIPKGGTVLDVGCGYGRLCQMASRYASRVVGIDYDPSVIAHAQETNRDSRVEFRVGDTRTGLPNERFDVVLVVAVLEHIEDVDQLLGDLRHLASRIIVEVPDFEADVLNLVRRDLECVWYTDADHVREYVAPVLQAHLERNGWIPREWRRRGGLVLVVADRGECTPPGTARISTAYN